MMAASIHPLRIHFRQLALWWRRVFSAWLEKAKTREPFFMIAVAIVIGIFCGFGAIGFRYLLDLMHVVFWGDPHATADYLRELPVWRRMLMPALGGLVVAPIVYLLVKEARGHGVPEVMVAVATKDGLIRGRVALAKAFASAVTIGSGGSAGPEGPIIQIGSAIGSKVGQLFKVSRKHLRTFVACGAAAGLSATFNAPIAGSLFAVEVILGQFGVAQFSPIVISAVVATVISRHYLGGETVFSVPGYELNSLLELGPYLLLGVMCGLLGVLMIRVLYRVEDFFEDQQRVPKLLKPALGGLLLGLMAWMIPQVYGDGEFVINQILHGHLAWWLLLLLVFAKLAATALTLGSGGSGGVFAPSLLLGAAAGGVIGHLVGAVLGDSAGAPGGYALVGMGGLVAATIHAPITAIIMIFEITNSYQIILPLMLVCIISTVISTKLNRESIYTLKLVRQGIDWLGGQSLDVLKQFKVRQVLRDDATRIAPQTPVLDIVERVMGGDRTQYYVVGEQGELIGVVHLSELSRVVTRREGLDRILLAEDLAHGDTPFCLPDESLNMALLKFEKSGLIELPVVESAEQPQLLGVLRYQEVIALYNNEILLRDTADGLAARMAISDRVEKTKLVTGIWMVEWQPPAEWYGRSLADIRLPSTYGVRVMLIKRKRPESQEIVAEPPGPDYVFAAGDALLIYGPESALEQLPQI